MHITFLSAHLKERVFIKSKSKDNTKMDSKMGDGIIRLKISFNDEHL
jgi:hypothetical protein